MSEHPDDRFFFEIDGEVFSLHPDLVRLARQGSFELEDMNEHEGADAFSFGNVDDALELPWSEGTFQRTWTKQGRNEPCACGSGLKHKKCCLRC